MLKASIRSRMLSAGQVRYFPSTVQMVRKSTPSIPYPCRLCFSRSSLALGGIHDPWMDGASKPTSPGLSVSTVRCPLSTVHSSPSLNESKVLGDRLKGGLKVKVKDLLEHVLLGDHRSLLVSF